MREVDRELAGKLSRELAVSPVIGDIVVSRGITAVEEARRYLAPSLANMSDPFLMLGMEQAVARLLRAVLQREKVCIYGDYDVDGITATALMQSVLQLIGCDCFYFIPSRFDDGYGLSREALSQIAESGAALVVSVDCGITALDEALFCRSLGMDLIITDHHTPREQIPDAVAVLNPLQPTCAYPFKALAGVGVAFNLLIALRTRLRQAGYFRMQCEPDLRQCFDLVALGTIADVVPLVDQNRLYVQQGLAQLARGARTGVASLKQVAGIAQGECSCGQVGFRLAPRLNAAGRLESAVPGVELLLGSRQAECDRIAAELDAANAERQAIERDMLEEAIAMVETAGTYPNRRSIVLASPGWHQGVVGIVASRLVERYHRPVILIAVDQDGYGKGSGRSIPDFHLLDAITSCGSQLERFGGHRFAAGIGLRAEQIEAFTAAFESEAACRLEGADLRPILRLDGEVRAADITAGLVRELKQLEPFGNANPEPTIMLRGVRVIERRIVGSRHLKLRLQADGCIFSAIAFQQAERETDGVLDLAFYPEFNEWNGRTDLQLRIKDFRSSE